MMDALARLNRVRFPFAELMGVRFVSAELDRVVAELEIRPELCTQAGIAHGGVLMSFADTLGAAATILNLPKGARTTTIESKTNFLAASPDGSVITGEATPVHRGRTTMVWQTRITTDGGRLAAVVTQTQMVLPART